jgi:hypothetical protein
MKLGTKKPKVASGIVGGEAAEKEKKPKRKASRGSGNSVAAAKEFLKLHVEKLLLGAMALAALLLIYVGFSKEPLGTSPDTIMSAVTTAQTSINSATWTDVKQQRFPEPDTFDQRATLDTISIDRDAYAIAQPLHPRLQERGKLRTDPELLPPFDIHVEAGYGALSIKAPEGRSNYSEIARTSSEEFRDIPSTFRANRRGETNMGGDFEGRFFVAITGLVPYKKQFDIYQAAFDGTAEYNAERDVPKYFGLEIERAEVNADGTLGQWVALKTVAGMKQEPMRWSGRAEERAEQDYILPMMAMDIPPIAMRDVTPWAVHPSIPKVDLLESGGRAVEERKDEAAVAPTDELKWGSADSASGEKREGVMHEPGRREPTGAEDSAYPSGEAAEPLLKVENGMLRYFDFTVEPGKAYAYRVQAVLEDPNNPEDGARPSDASCEPTVIVRRKEASEPIRTTPFSEPSSTVRVPSGNVVLAGSVNAPIEVAVGPNKVRIPRRPTDEPTVKVLALAWDSKGPYDAVIQTDVARGAVVNGVADAEAIDPSVQRVRMLKQYRYQTDTMVLDIYGGSKIKSSDDLTAPGYMLVMDPYGRLQFRGEMEDRPRYEENFIPPEEEESSLRASPVEGKGEEEIRLEEPGPEEPAPEGGRERRRGPRSPRGGRGARGAAAANANR